MEESFGCRQEAKVARVWCWWLFGWFCCPCWCVNQKQLQSRVINQEEKGGNRFKAWKVESYDGEAGSAIFSSRRCGNL